MVKDIFLYNGGQRNMFAYVTRSNRPRCFFHLLKGPNPSYLVLNFSNILPINNWDMAQNVILQRSWPWKVKVIGKNKWHQLKGFYSSYLVLKFGNVLPVRNWDISRNVILQMSWPWKVKIIGQNKWHYQIPWPQKHRSRHQNFHPKCFSSKVIVKDIFLHNGGQRNAFGYVTRSNCPRYFFVYWKASIQAILF